MRRPLRPPVNLPAASSDVFPIPSRTREGERLSASMLAGIDGLLEGARKPNPAGWMRSSSPTFPFTDEIGGRFGATEAELHPVDIISTDRRWITTAGREGQTAEGFKADPLWVLRRFRVHLIAAGLALPGAQCPSRYGALTAGARRRTVPMLAVTGDGGKQSCSIEADAVRAIHPLRTGKTCPAGDRGTIRDKTPPNICRKSNKISILQRCMALPRGLEPLFSP